MRKITGESRAKKNHHVPKQRDLLYSQTSEEIAASLNNPKKVDTFERTMPKAQVDIPQPISKDYGTTVDRVKGLRKTGLRFDMIEKQVS